MKFKLLTLIFCLFASFLQAQTDTSETLRPAKNYPRLLEIGKNHLVFEAMSLGQNLSFGRTSQLEMGAIEPVQISRGGAIAKVYPINNLQPATCYYAALPNGDVGVFVTQSLSSGLMAAYFNRPVETGYANPTPANYLPGNQLLDTIIAKINAATSTIDVAIYNTSRTDFVAALTAAANRGVRVRFVTDVDENNFALDPAPVFPVLRGAPGSGTRMHNKFIVIDADFAQESWVIGGSMNYTQSNVVSDPNNVIMIQDQSLALAYEMEFEEMWGGSGALPNLVNSRFGDDKLDNTPHQFNINGKSVSLYFSPSDGTSAQIVNALNTANNDLMFALLTFTYGPPSQSICNTNAAVRGLIENVNDVGSEFDFLTNTCGRDVRDWTASGQLHHKYAVVDGNQPNSDPLVITGSHNWTLSAEINHDENTLIIRDAEIANHFVQEFEARWCEDLNLANCFVATPLTVNITSNVPQCGDTTNLLLAGALGGTPGYAFLWSNGATTNGINVPEGLYSVTVTDGTGATASAVAEAITDDLVPPAIQCLPTQALNDPNGVALPDYTLQVVVQDNCGATVLVQTPAPGTFFDATQTVMVTLTATDASGNTAECFFAVDIVVSGPICTPDAAAVTWFVDAAAVGANNGTSWANAFTSLQSALAAATNGSNILIAEGTYYPTTGTNRNISFVLKAGVDLYGGFPAGGGGPSNPQLYPTVLSGEIGDMGSTGDNSNRVLRAVNLGNDVFVCGLTVQNAYASGLNGGGVYIQANGTGVQCSPEFSHCTFTQNFTEQKGGGAFVYAYANGSANPTFAHCTLSYNQAANDGGGLASLAQAGGTIDIQFDQCSISVNGTNKKGAGLLNWANQGASINVSATGTVFNVNTAAGNGGAVWNYARSGGAVAFGASSCAFIGNTANAGGAIFNLAGGGSTNCVLDSCMFDVNSTVSSGGALAQYSEFAGASGTVMVNNCWFSNSSALDGGALANFALRGATSQMDIANTTFSDNLGSGSGGAAYQSANSLNAAGTVADLQFVNSLFYQNLSPNGPGGVFAQAGTTNTTVTAGLMNATCYANSANGQGNIVFSNTKGVGSGFSVANSIFWANSSFLPSAKPFWIADASAAAQVSFSLLEMPTCAGNAAGSGVLNCGQGVLFAVDPQFVDESNGNLRLAPGAPGIDAGTLVGAPANDLDGIVRPQGNGIDMGVYESEGQRPQERAVEEEVPAFEAQIFPNPTVGAFTVVLDRAVTGVAQLFSSEGRLLVAKPLNGVRNVFFENQGNTNGFYLVRIVHGGFSLTKKLVVNK